MLSSLDTYNFYTRDTLATRERLSTDSITAREAQYFQTAIQNITTVDEFLDDDRAYSYAMKAYGLEEMTYAKGLIRKVLESDLTDENSFANLLTDTRYKDFAAAFDFGLTQGEKVIQTTEQQDDMIAAYQAQIDQTNTNQQEELSYFKAVMATISNATELLANERARNFIFNTLGLPTENYDYNTVFNAITSDPNDPNGYVQTVLQPNIDNWEQQRADLYAQRDSTLFYGFPTDETTQLDEQRSLYLSYIEKTEIYIELAGLFNFNSDGTLIDNTSPQDATQYATLEEKYLIPNSSARVTYGVALLNKAYYEEKIATADHIDDIILFDDRLKTIAYAAYNLSPDLARSEVYEALSDYSADQSAALTKWGQNMIDFIEAFNFDETGTLITGQEAQSTENTAKAMETYLYTYDDEDVADDEDDIDDFKRFISLTIDVDDFLSDVLAANIVREFSLKAYNIGTDEFTTRQLKDILTSDPADPDSYLNQLNDERLYKLVKVLNFGEDGQISAPRMAQSESEITRVSVAYYEERTRLDDSDSNKADAEEEVEYYRNQLVRIDSADEFINDDRLVSFLATAEGIDQATLDAQLLLQLFTSDMDDADSFANQQTDIALKKIAGSFNFGVNGAVIGDTVSGAQSSRGLIETQDLYITQMMEEEAGESSVGARLALYFERSASEITSMYDIIADEALAQFVRTTFSMPDEIASSDVDAQAELYEKVISIEELQDPDRVSELVTRFLALYDIENQTDNTVATLFSSSASFNAETLASFAQYRSQI